MVQHGVEALAEQIDRIRHLGEKHGWVLSPPFLSIATALCRPSLRPLDFLKRVGIRLGKDKDDAEDTDARLDAAFAGSSETTQRKKNKKKKRKSAKKTVGDGEGVEAIVEELQEEFESARITDELD